MQSQERTEEARNQKRLLRVVIAMVGFATSIIGNDLLGAAELAREGKTSFVIVTTATPSPEETTTAEWLSDTLARVTGATFPVQPASKDDDAVSLKPQTIRIRSRIARRVPRRARAD